MERGKIGMDCVKFIDLFAGIGGMRLGFERAFESAGFRTRCVMTSEIKPRARAVLEANHPGEGITGDITEVDAAAIPDFDFLLAGFPCQAFSMAGNRAGFADTRGTMFFEVARILEVKKPFGFLLENVEGLVSHDKGRTLATILGTLDSLGYSVAWNVLNAKDFGVPQDRKRIYIAGVLGERGGDFRIARPEGFRKAVLGDVLERGLPVVDSAFTRALLLKYRPSELYGKSIRDKRGGKGNIHSWDIGLKGDVSAEESALMGMVFKERRKKKYAEEHGIEWMDGMPLTLSMIRGFCDFPDLGGMLSDLVSKGYLKIEHPKALVTENGRTFRKEDAAKEPGYNIVSGKLSFPVSRVLDPDGVAPTLVATDMGRLAVVDGDGIRPLSMREGLRCFGYPDSFLFPAEGKEGYDLLGNTVCVPAVGYAAGVLAAVYKESVL